MVHASACECAGWPREPAQRYTQEWVGQICLVPSPKGVGSPCAIQAFGWLRAGILHNNAILAGVVFLSVRLCQAPLCHIQPPTHHFLPVEFMPSISSAPFLKQRLHSSWKSSPVKLWKLGLPPVDSSAASVQLQLSVLRPPCGPCTHQLKAAGVVAAPEHMSKPA